MNIELEIGKYNEKSPSGEFQKMNFETIDEALATINFIALGYDLFKNGEGLVVRLEKGAKPFLIDFDSAYAIEELGKELRAHYKGEHTNSDYLKDRGSLNSNFIFKEDDLTKYAKTSSGETLPFKIFATNESEKTDNLLINDDNSTDFALVERQFAENKNLEFLGAERIENHNDVAWLFKSLEDEAIEHAFLVYHFEDKGYFVQHISTGTFNQALVDNKTLIGNVIKAKPSAITLVHNHPSGSLKASRADIKCIENLRKALQYSDIEVNPGVIINLRSGKYLVFDDNNYSTIKLRVENNKKLNNIQQYSFSKQVLVANYQPINVTSSKEVASFISSQKFGISDKTEMLVMNSQLNIVGKFVMPPKNQVDFIIEKVTQFGGMNCIIYGNNISPEEINFYNERLKYSGMAIIDGLLFKGSNGEKIYNSFMDDQLLDRGLIEENVSGIAEEKNSIIKTIQDMEQLSWFDRTMTPKTTEYKDFVHKMQNSSPEEFFEGGARDLSDKEKKFLKIYQNLDYPFSIIAADTKENSTLLYHFEDKKQVIDFIDKIEFQDLKSYNLRDNEKQIDFPIGDRGEREKLISDLWQRENKELKFASGLSIRDTSGNEFTLTSKVAEGIWEGRGLSGDKIIFESEAKYYEKTNTEIIGGKIKDIANQALTTPENLNKLDENTRNTINLFINNQNPKIMEQTQDFNQVQYLKDQMKYLGFGESENLHKDLENGINSPQQQFEIKTTSDKSLPENKIEFTLNFNKSEQGGVFLNSYKGELNNGKDSSISHNFPVNKGSSFTAKEAVNLLEGRAVKIEFTNPKTDQLEPAFVKLNFSEPKTEKGNYNFQNFYKNYGVDTLQIVEKSNLVFDKPEYKENTIASLEKGNIVKVKFKLEDKVVEGKAVLNPQYKNLSLYDQDMTRINTNKPLEGLDNDQKNQKANVREQSMSRGI